MVAEAAGPEARSARATGLATRVVRGVDRPQPRVSTGLVGRTSRGTYPRRFGAGGWPFGARRCVHSGLLIEEWTHLELVTESETPVSEDYSRGI